MLRKYQWWMLLVPWISKVFIYRYIQLLFIHQSTEFTITPSLSLFLFQKPTDHSSSIYSEKNGEICMYIYRSSHIQVEWIVDNILVRWRDERAPTSFNKLFSRTRYGSEWITSYIVIKLFFFWLLAQIPYEIDY